MRANVTAHYVEVSNPRTQRVLGNLVQVANGAEAMSIGLLDRESLNPGEGLWLVPCRSVHTLGMKFPIDIVFLDSQNHVYGLDRHSVPGRAGIAHGRTDSLALVHEARGWNASVLEFPEGTIDATQTRMGDYLSIRPV